MNKDGGNDTFVDPFAKCAWGGKLITLLDGLLHQTPKMRAGVEFAYKELTAIHMLTVGQNRGYMAQA